MSARTLARLTVALGLAALIAFLWLGGQEAVRSVYSASEVSIQVSAFQRAETAGDIADVLGAPPDPRVVAAHDAINRVDLFGFVPTYALFLSAAAIMLGGLRNRWTLAAIGFALLGAGADAVETSRQLALTADIENAHRHLPIAPWHWLKYLGLALNGVAVASIALTSAPRRLVLAVLAFAPLPLVAGAYVDLLSTRFFAAAFGVYWVALLLIALMETVRGRGAQA